MNNLFVPYDIALSLKKIGFDEHCFGHYNYNTGEINYWHDNEIMLERTNKWFNDSEQQYPKMNKGGCTAPLYDQVIDWLEEKHNLLLYCTKINGDWLWKIDSATGGYLELCYDTFTNRKDGLNAGIKKAIELIKQKS